MAWEAWLTLGVVAAVVVVMVGEWMSPPIAILGGVTLLLAIGVIDAEQALAGFSNPAPVSVAALYVLAAAAGKTGILERLTARILRTVPTGSRGYGKALVRILVPTAALSGFLNNTPIVAMVAPGIAAWARRTGRSPSAFLMPVSFAAILGGLTTLIGTSTNLVVHGLLQESGRGPLGLFEIGAVGVPVAAVGIVVLVVLAPRLIPQRRTLIEDVAGDSREFTVEMVLDRGSALAGMTVAEANLRNLDGVFLVEIERDGHRIAPVGPDEPLAEGDRLTFAGNVDRVLDLHRLPGLVSAERPHFSVLAAETRRTVFECVLADGSPLANSTLKAVGFRARYGGAVLAVHRRGERIPAKLGSLLLRPGDVLLVLADPGFKQRWTGRRDFLVVAPLEGGDPPRTEKVPVVIAVTAALLVVVATGLIDILAASLLAAFALVATRVLTPIEARDAVDVNVVLIIAASFGLGEAIAGTGLARTVADVVLLPFSNFGDIGILLGVLVATIALTELITNNAAAVLMFPIAMATAQQTGMNPRALAIAIAVAASLSFLTPIGYQTNTMVYGMGGYRFSDFARVGAPLTLVALILGLVVIPLWWPLRG